MIHSAVMMPPRQTWFRCAVAIPAAAVILTAFADVGQPPPDGSSAAGETTALDPVQVVSFRGRPLFEVRAQLGELTPADRVAAISLRIEKVVQRGKPVLDDIGTEERSRWTEIRVGDEYLMSVTDADAAPTGRTRQQLAADYAVALRAALMREFEGRSTQGLVLGAAITLVATAVLFIVLHYLNLLAPRLRTAIRDAGVRYIRSARFRGADIVPLRSIAEILVQISRFLQVLIILLASLVYLEIVLSAFPWTSELAGQLLDAVTDAFSMVVEGLFGYLPTIFYIAVILFVTHYLLRFARIFFIALSRGSVSIAGFYPEWAMPSYNILRFLTYALAAVVIFPYLPGSGSPAFQGVSIFLGVLFSLGSTSAVANMVAGVVLTYMRSFRDGDRVKIADTIGDVIEKNLLIVRVRTIKNVEVTIPNAMVLNNHIINFSACARDKGLILHTTVTIGYDAPWQQVHELLKAAAMRTTSVLADPAPFVLQTALNDFHVSYELNAFTDDPGRMAITYSELHQHIQDEFNKAGVEIMSPHYVAARDGNQATIPDEHLPSNYNPPAFRILPVPAADAPVKG